MKVVIDAFPLLLRSAGVKSYLYHWIQALRAIAPEQIETFPRLKSLPQLDHEQSLGSRWITWSSIALVLSSNRTQLPLMDSVIGDADIFHATNQIRRPPRRPRWTATLHDLTCWTHPEMHTPGNIQADREFAEFVLKKAHRLIAVSENTRQDALRHLKLRPEQVVTIHSGVDEAYFTVSSDEVKRVRLAHELSKPYVLTVGTIEPRKNIDRLLDAWRSLPAVYREQFDLVFAGPAGWAGAGTVERLRTQNQGVRWLGYVTEPDLPALTHGAELLAYPSLYEGFGFPVAQALAAGTAVLTSNRSSLPEVAGPGAWLVDPLSVEEIAAALRCLLDSPGERERLARLGQAHARSFRWDRCARQSLDFFAAAAS